MGVIAGLVAFGLGYASGPRGAKPARPHAPTTFETGVASFELHLGAAQIAARSRDGSVSRDIDLALLVDGARRPLAIARQDLRPGTDSVRATVPVSLDDSTVDVELELKSDPAHDALVISLDAASSATGHTLALTAELASEGEVVFVSGVGQIADRASVAGHVVIIDSEPHPIALLSRAGAIGIDAVPENTAMPVEPIHLFVTSPDVQASTGHRTDLSIVVATSSVAAWRSIAELSGEPTALVRGHVTGATERSLVFGRDAQGVPQVRAHVDPGGAFALEVPKSVVQWYAAVDPGRASGLASFVPGTPRDLVLDVSPGGDLHVAITDADTGAPLTARLVVHGIDGTVDPSFGPDYRASGAGPVIDALHGDVTTPLPSGHYRIAATRGIEWSIDAKTVTIVPGRVAVVDLAPRHVVPTPGVLGCDLHVHARPSFDSPVVPEDRVLSLVAAGIDFAVPTEHNVVGNYAPSIETLDLGRELLSVPGVEVTTYSKGFGHFGVFPYPLAAPVPPYKHTNMASIFRAVRANDPNRYFQLNHPRLPKGIGYFNNIGFDPKAPRTHIHNRVDFDGIEVYNGYDSELPERVDQVLRDYWALLDFGWRYAATGSSDSHRIQYHWAGYPRTMVTVDSNASALEDEKAVDPLVVVANIKKGHAVVTSGPMIEFELDGVRPGDELSTTDDPILGHVRVRAAPWIDVTRVDVVAGQIGGTYKIVGSFEVPSRPTAIGPEPGTLAEAQDRTIRLDRDLAVSVGPENGWVQIVVRGDRPMDDVLPFVPVPPMGFTNPVYVVRHAVAPPPFPGVPLNSPPAGRDPAGTQSPAP
jgi:hypothetical protein